MIIIDPAESIDRFLPQLTELGVRSVDAVDDLARPGQISEAAGS